MATPVNSARAQPHPNEFVRATGLDKHPESKTRRAASKALAGMALARDVFNAFGSVVLFGKIDDQKIKRINGLKEILSPSNYKNLFKDYTEDFPAKPETKQKESLGFRFFKRVSSKTVKVTQVTTESGKARKAAYKAVGVITVFVANILLAGEVGVKKEIKYPTRNGRIVSSKFTTRYEGIKNYLSIKSMKNGLKVFNNSIPKPKSVSK